MSAALPGTAGSSIDVYNTNSWARGGLILLTPQQSAAGDLVKDDRGAVVVSQRLSTGELAFVALDVKPSLRQKVYDQQGESRGGRRGRCYGEQPR
ncbi:hypothetical protein ACQ86N_22170 [Puia sp. P3]|uniref:hypothetical protein n=1 Tax=Puia sp. P3 TaxID=3423952 RepID=UPI003D664807